MFDLNALTRTFHLGIQLDKRINNYLHCRIHQRDATRARNLARDLRYAVCFSVGLLVPAA